MSREKATEFQWGFSLNKQSAMITAITSVQINKALPIRGFAPFMKEIPNTVSDRQWFGKGHNYPTFFDILTNRVVIPNREFSMTQNNAAFAFAMLMGSVASTRPNSATAPTVYDHLFTFQDQANDNVIFTSLLEKGGAEWEKLITGAVVDRVTLRGMREDHVVLGWEGHAYDMTDSVIALPSLMTGESFFQLLKSTISFGDNSGALPDITALVDQFNLTFDQNPNYRFEPGNAAGTEGKLSRVLIGDQTVSGSIRILVDNTVRNLFLNGTLCGLTIVLTGDTIISTFKNTVTVSIPNFKLAAEAIDQEGDQAAITLTFDENTVLKTAAAAYCSVTVRAAIPITELLVNA